MVKQLLLDPHANSMDGNSIQQTIWAYLFDISFIVTNTIVNVLFYLIVGTIATGA